MQQFINNLDKALQYSASGQKARADELYYDIAEQAIQKPFMLWEDKAVLKLGKAFNIMYHSELFEEEHETLACLHFAYVYCHRASILLKNESETDRELLFDALKTLVLITNLGEDGFYHSIANLYQLRSNGNCSIQEGVKLAQAISPMMQFDFLLQLEDRLGGFEADEYLSSICEEIEHDNPDMNQNLIEEGKNIRSLLAQYIEKRMREGIFEF